MKNYIWPYFQGVIPYQETRQSSDENQNCNHKFNLPLEVSIHKLSECFKSYNDFCPADKTRTEILPKFKNKVSVYIPYIF